MNIAVLFKVFKTAVSFFLVSVVAATLAKVFYKQTIAGGVMIVREFCILVDHICGR